jgi:hypothetical protein
MGTLISWNPLGHYRPLTGLLYLLLLDYFSTEPSFKKKKKKKKRKRNKQYLFTL